MNTTAKISALSASKSASEVAEILSVSRAYVYAVAKKKGIKFATDGRRRTSKLPRRPTERQPGIRISSQTAGAWAELIACAHLLGFGCGVFRSVSPNCPVDLIARNAAGDCFSVEVRCGTKRGDGSISYAAPQRDHDILAVVLPDASVHLKGRCAENFTKPTNGS